MKIAGRKSVNDMIGQRVGVEKGGSIVKCYYKIGAYCMALTLLYCFASVGVKNLFKVSYLVEMCSRTKTHPKDFPYYTKDP